MARGAKTVFICQSCGYQVGKWLGRCPECGAWNSLAEEVVAPAGPLAEGQLPPRRGAPQPLARLQTPPETRLATGLTEFDRPLGGSLAAGPAVLGGGGRGIGQT